MDLGAVLKSPGWISYFDATFLSQDCVERCVLTILDRKLLKLFISF